jgi:hypothetical protein
MGARDMARESKSKRESRSAKSPLKRTESVRRAEVREFLQHLTIKKRLITTEKEGREWAESVRSSMMVAHFWTLV